MEQERQAHLRRDAKVAEEAQALAQLLSAVNLTILRKAGENDHLFGSVTAADIGDALAAQKFTVDRRKIQLDEPIRTLGDFKIPVKLHRDVTAEVSVQVKRED